MTQLEIIITNGWATLIIVGLIVVAIFLYNSFKTKTELIAQKKAADLKVQYQQWAFDEFEKFKKNEIAGIQKSTQEQSIKAASVLLQEWKMEHESKIRQDAINRSYSVNLGKISEHLLPFHVKFPFNPQDARFLGSPIDMIVFDGHSEKKDDITVYIVEIKTGRSRLTDGQKKIKEAVIKGNVVWHEINPAMLELDKIVDELKLPVPDSDNKSNGPTIDDDIETLKDTTEKLISDGAEDFQEVLTELRKEPAYNRLCKNKDFNIADFEKQLLDFFE
jgi:predicted Holliday junction resolvase-like endonuclease